MRTISYIDVYRFWFLGAAVVTIVAQLVVLQRYRFAPLAGLPAVVAASLLGGTLVARAAMDERWPLGVVPAVLLILGAAAFAVDQRETNLTGALLTGTGIVLFLAAAWIVDLFDLRRPRDKDDPQPPDV